MIFNLTAEEGQLVTALMRVVDAQKKVEDGATKMSQAAKAGAEAMRATARQQQDDTTALGTAIEALPNIATAASAAMMAFGEVGSKVMEDMKAKTEAFKERFEILQQTMGLSGQINLLPQIEAAVKSISDTSKTMDEKAVSQLFAQVHKSSKGNLTTAQELETVTSAVQAADAGLGAEGASTFAKTRVALQKHLLSGESKGGLDDATTTLLKSLPEGLDTNQERFINLASASKMSPDKVLEMLAGSARGGAAGKKTLEQFIQLAEKDITTPERHQEVAPAAKAEIEKIKAEITDLEETKLTTRGKSRHKAIEKQIEERRIQIQRLEQQKIDKPLTAEEQSDQALAGFAPGDQRVAEMLSHPESLPPKLRLAMKNLGESTRHGEFHARGGFQAVKDAHAQVLSENAAYRDLESVKAVEKETANIHSNPDAEARKQARLVAQFQQNLEESPKSKAFLEFTHTKGLAEWLYGKTHKTWDDEDGKGPREVKLVNGGNRPMVSHDAGNER